jgi:hypothetical protein
MLACEIKICLLFGMEVEAVRGNQVDLATEEILLYEQQSG